MKQANARLVPFLIALTLGALLAFSGDSHAAEKKKFSFTKGNRVTISEVKSSPGHGRELVQGVYSDWIKASDPEWDGIEERVFDQSEQVDGTGTHRGSSIDIFRNGDQLYQNYSGTHKTTVKGDAWETTYEGISEIVGGTGKYKNARGRISYAGKITSNGVEEQNNVELEY